MMNKPQLRNIDPCICELPPVRHLSNGVELNVVPLESTELVAVCIMFNGGQWVQDKRLQSDFAIQQLRSGSGAFSSSVITEKLDYYGTTLTAGANLPYSFVQLMSLRRNLRDVLPILCDLITSPAYEQEKLDIGREEMLFAYNVSRQRASEECKKLFYRKVLGGANPAAQFPEEQDYLDINREDLCRYHKQYLSLDNAVIYLTGKIDEALVQLIDETLGRIPCRGASMLVHQEVAIPATVSAVHESYMNVSKSQSALRVGKVLPDFTHPDYPALLLVNTILGGYFGSRLMSNIRERLGFTYGIGSLFYHIPKANVFVVATETPKEHVEQCVDEIKKEIVDLQTNLVSEEEMTSVKNYLIGQFCRMTETSLSLSNVMMVKRTYGQRLTDILAEYKAIQTLTANDVQRVAKEHFSVDELLVAAVHGK